VKLIILAGGSGTRLFPLSREDNPKQFLNIGLPESLLVSTIRRFLPIVREEDIVIVTNERHHSAVITELDRAHFSKIHILKEPCKKNTLPAICFGIAFLRESLACPDDEIIFISPADHIIEPQDKFIEAVNEAVTAASEGYLVTFGVKPTRADSGFGYIKYGRKLAFGFEVEHFVEKPESSRAQGFIREGKYYWNSGMFVFNIRVFEDELKKANPVIHSYFRSHDVSGIPVDYQMLPDVSIDKGVIEKTDKLISIPLVAQWIDIGTWASVYDFLEKDKNGNAVIGECISKDSSGSLFVSSSRPIVSIGLKDLIVVETENVVFVSQRNQIHKIKEMVEKYNESRSP
jgi:mannose-1-phosphate guanylyltransferase/mannose-6-phosphate isomerase